MLTSPGERSRTFQGDGQFDIDLAQGVFLTTGRLVEYDLVGSGGSSFLEIEGGGALTSSGRLSGLLSYSGASGPLEGAFYGPNAEELGASFLATNKFGTVLNGAMTGQRDGSLTPTRSMTLLNITQDALLGSSIVGVEVLTPAGQALGIVRSPDGGPIGGVVLTPTGPRDIQLTIGAISDLARDQVQPRENFTRYTGQSPTAASVQLDFYNTGAGNSEIALTYASFVTWREQTTDTQFDGSQASVDRTSFLTYGIEPAIAFLNGLTETARYLGAAYGVGASPAGERSIRGAFYGPSGQEIGASFTLYAGPSNHLNTVVIEGVALAIQR